MSNPFHLTRAADLDDAQIRKFWVDPKNKLATMLRPASPLPMILRGGRGSGKTHLLRYHSYSLQRQIYGPTSMGGRVAQDKYIGIFYRCGGLRANRFSSKRTHQLQWQPLFALYLELTLGQLLLKTALEYLRDVQHNFGPNEDHICKLLTELFDQPVKPDISDLDGFLAFLGKLQRELDSAINMASFRKAVIPEFTITPGALIFGIPRILANAIPCLRGVMFTLFIDEYEHLYEDMQKHVNTLIRERENPVSFKIGVRLHGIRTHQTWGGDEELKEGSDYELLDLDATLRSEISQYSEFAWELCLKRIQFADGKWPDGWEDATAKSNFIESFCTSQKPETIAKHRLQERDQESPWLASLRDALRRNARSVENLGVTDKDCAAQIVALLTFRQDVLIEKTNVFLFYSAWSRRKHLPHSAANIHAAAVEYYSNRSPNSLHGRKLSHFRDDMRDQMLMDLELDRQAGPNGLMSRYLGVDTWIRMSDGIIRNLITTLKCVYDWSQFRGESVFSRDGISLVSQSRGIQEASEWFLGDANVLQADRGMVEAGMRRIATLLRKLRYSKKPPECSLCRFSVDLNQVSSTTRRIIEAAEMWSLLIRDANRRSRNPGGEKVQYRLNPLVCPDYYLPISARGNIDLSPEECDAIFGTEPEDNYQRAERERIRRCTPPFPNSARSTDSQNSEKFTQTDTNDDEFRLF